MEATIPCVCPPKADGQPRHEQDTITFRDRLDFRAGLAIRKQLALEKGDDPDMAAGEILAILTESYLIYGVESWSLLNDRGKPVEVTRTAIRAFMDGHPEEAMAAGDAADDLYAEQVLLPLLQRASTSSQQSPTPEETSATPGSSESQLNPRKSGRSKHSSTSSTPTGGTGTITTLPAGGSRSSPSSATAA